MSQFVSDAQSVWPGARTESAPETRAGKDSNICEDDLGQESMASDAESYQRGPWRRPDPRITAGFVATACALARRGKLSRSE